jgi:hypothetical protein
MASNARGVIPATVAVTRFAPGAAPSVQFVVANPALSVTLVAGVTDPPPATTVQLTDAPANARPELSLTETPRAVGKADPVTPVWLLPDTMVMEAAVTGAS